MLPLRMFAPVVAVVILLVTVPAGITAFTPNGTYKATGVIQGLVGGSSVVNTPYTTNFTVNGKSITGKITNKPTSLTLKTKPLANGASTRNLAGGSVQVVYGGKVYGFTVTGGKFTFKENNKGKTIFNGTMTGFGTGNAAGTDLFATAKGTKS